MTDEEIAMRIKEAYHKGFEEGVRREMEYKNKFIAIKQLFAAISELIKEDK